MPKIKDLIIDDGNPDEKCSRCNGTGKVRDPSKTLGVPLIPCGCVLPQGSEDVRDLVR